MCSTQDVRFAEGAIDEGRGFANKLWNAARLILLNIDPEASAAPNAASTIDAWVLSRLASTTRSVTEQLESYQFSSAVKELYTFVWNDVCDWYLEALKLRLYGDDAAVRRASSETALFVLERMLALLHPVMPFVTEEIWSLLPGDRGLLMQSSYPGDDAPSDVEAERSVGVVIETVTSLRRMRADAGLPPRALVTMSIAGGPDAGRLRRQADLLAGLGHCEIGVVASGIALVVGDAELTIQADGLAEALQARVAKRLAEAERELAKDAPRLANEKFLAGAPEPVVDEVRQRVAGLEREIAALRAQLR